MQYPLISEYITAIRSGEDTFDKLSHLRPVLDDAGNPVMSSGNFAVVFKMTDGTKLYALKCFLKEQNRRDEAYKMITEELEDVSSAYIIHIAYFEKELFESYVQGDNEELNAEDLQKVLEQMKNGTFDYDVELPEDALSVKDIPETDSNDTACKVRH